MTTLNREAVNYRILLQVTNVLTSQRDTDGLWRAITEQIKQVIPWERAGLTLYDPEIDAFRFYAVETHLQQRALQRETVIQRSGSAVGWVFEHRRPHIRPDLHRERVFLEDEYYVREGLRRMINLPLLVQDACLGTLNLGSVEAGEPHQEDIEFLQQVATQIAFAIDHVRSYEQIDRLRQQLASENESLLKTNEYLVEELKLIENFGDLVGKSRAFQQVLQLAKEVAATDATVLITGETGTGKEILARAIHEAGPRRHRAFVRINCAALPAGLVESELFGHERGAFTGAQQRHRGRFELAHRGTLFLDEIGELPLEAQAKLLRVLQDGVVDRVGGTESVPVDVRVIAATNADLTAGIADGRFRADLFYRLHVFPVTLPPLRDRREDIPLLTAHFIEHYNRKLRRNCQEVAPDSLARLMQYHWPGNIRELQNVIERAMILSRSPVLHIGEHLLGSAGPGGRTATLLRLQDVERAHILQVLERANWRIAGPQGAADLLGLHPNTLRSRMERLGLRQRKSSRRHESS